MKKVIQSLFLACFFFTTLKAYMQPPAPTAEQKKSFVIVGGIIHDGKGNVFHNKNIFVDRNRITKISDETPQGGNIIDARNQHIYPGFILPNTYLGLIEVEAVRSTADFEEYGYFNPHIRSLIAYNAESELIPTFRYNGVLLAQITPQSDEGISGTSSLVQLDAWNWEDAVVKSDDGIHLYWPDFTAVSDKSDDDFKKDKTVYQNRLNELYRFFDGAKEYAFKDSLNNNLKLKAMKGLFKGTKTLFIHSEHAPDLMAALVACDKWGISKIVLITNHAVLDIIDMVKARAIPVIVNGVHKLPATSDDNVDASYALPAKLHQAGVLVGLGQQNAHISNGRNLPFLAGHAVSFGLDKESALSLITSNTAKILGIDNNYGSIEVGKSATLFISEGDALDIRTNRIQHAFIDGRQISLDAKQQRLYHKYSDKYGIKR